MYSPVHALPVTESVKPAATRTELEMRLDSDNSWKRLELEQFLLDSEFTSDDQFHLTTNQTDPNYAMHDFLLQEKINGPNQSNSPNSSPSIRSFYSASFHSPQESDSGQQMYSCQDPCSIPTHCSSTYPQSMSSDETGYEQFDIMTSPTLLFGNHESQNFLDSCILSDLDEEDEIGDTPSVSKRIHSTSGIDKGLNIDDHEKQRFVENRHFPSDSNETARPSGRPQSLSFRSNVTEASKTVGLSHQSNDLPLSFTNTPTPFFGLEEQLASVDIAWMGALDIPNICLDEVEKILSPSSCLTSPVKDLPQNNNSAKFSNALIVSRNQLNISTFLKDQSASTWSDQASQCNLITATSNLVTSTSGTITNSDGKNACSTDNHISSTGFTSESTSLDRKANELADSDSTLTCSEAEYYSNWIQQHCKRARRKRAYRRARVGQVILQTDSDSDSGTDEPREWNTSLLRRLSSGTRRFGTRQRNKSQRRSTKSPSDSDMKPWWPKSNASFWGGCGISIDIPQSVNESESSSPRPVLPIDDDQLMSSTSDTEAPKSNDSGCVSSSPYSSPNINSSSPHGVTNHNRNKLKILRRPLLDHGDVDTMGQQQAIWRTRRRRKQLELWQFILCKLETSKHSAFQWVNRSAGVFCITDTVAGAREWGRYRNNSRMDYEKMARAMRFYYKDCILRKARQQLHFQFAMSYVEWASRFYHTV